VNLLYSNDSKGEFPPSYYAATAADVPRQPPLRGEVEADVCVIGAGLTGLSTALHLAERGIKVVVLEAHRAGFGASGRNGGQVGSGQRNDQIALKAKLGADKARALWQIAEDAKALVRDLIVRHDMPCTFKPGIAHAFTSASEVSEAQRYGEMLAKDYAYTQTEHLDQKALSALIGSNAYAGGELDHGAGHVHPLNFALGLARAALAAGVRIFEGTEVLGLEPGSPALVRAQSGHVRAGQVVLACNGYLGRLQPKVAARVMPINNFIIATEPLGEAVPLARDIAVADSKFMVNYWRMSDDGRLLFGGGESYGYRFPDIVATVRKPMLQIYPQLKDARIDYAWGGTLAITPTRNPLFWREGNIWSASGYSGHGVALATMAGRILSEAIEGQMGRFDTMASLPVPRFPGGSALRHPILVLAMTWFGLRDRLGV
jgi:gamma-glutamylputrescine oxidase